MSGRVAAEILKKHQPLIRFRYGVNAAGASQVHQSSLVSPLYSSEVFKTKETVQEVPLKFRRRNLSQLEMEAISLGGAGFKI